MKKMKITALVLALVCLACVCAGCANDKWDDIKNKDVVATVNGAELTKQHVRYFNAENFVGSQVSANLMSQMGISDAETEDADEDLEIAFEDALTYSIVGELARANGFSITEDEAYEKAYQEYVLMEKKPGYDYIKEYNDSIKEMLFFDTDMLVDFGSQKMYNSVPAMDYIKSLLEEMQYDYPNDDNKNTKLKAAVAERLKDEAKEVEVTFNYHKASKVNALTYEDIVSRAATTFTRAAEEE